MGFLSRLYNLWKGFLGIFVGKLEEKHPEIAYENAITSMTEKYVKLKQAAAGLIKHRAQLESRIQKTEKGLEEARLHVQIAVDNGDDASALVLLEKQEELEGVLGEDRAELESAANQAERAKESLRAVQQEVQKLKTERDRVIAQIKDAEARKQIQDQLEGLSVDDEIQALSNVREYADRVKAEAQIGDEIKESSIDAKLDKIKAQTGSAKAKARLDAMKAAKNAKEGGSGATEAEAPEKTL